jgi:hypothetical protein
MARRNTFTIHHNTSTSRANQPNILAGNHRSQDSDVLMMNTEETSLYANVSVEHQTQIPTNITARPQRLEAARERIKSVCAERNYFSPAFQLVRYDYSEGLCPPHPGQVQRDLQKLFEKFLELGTATADAVYEDISLKVWEMANDEHLHFDWETFQETAGTGVRHLREQGYLFDFDT